VVAWWDYGDWLSDIGNVTTLCDNTTYNSTQIANVGYIMMGNENQSMQMLNVYNGYGLGRVNYILVYLVLDITEPSSGVYSAGPAGYGDEGKFEWMAAISGTYETWYEQNGYMNASIPEDSWSAATDAAAFGNVSSTTNQWVWSDQGENCTINELMYYAAVQYCNELTNSGLSITPSWTATAPTYFAPVEIAGLSTSPGQYGGLVPLVAIYSINYTEYYLDTGAVP